MNDRVEDNIDALLSCVNGDEGEICSFVSEKNDNVSSVQFVIKTDAVEIPEEDIYEETQEEPLNFWQKLLRLFGIVV